MRLIFVLTILLAFNSFSRAENSPVEQKIVSQDKCLKTIAESKARASRSWHLLKEYLVIQWGSGSNCIGFDQVGSPHKLKDSSICMVQAPPLAQTVDNNHGCYAITPVGGILCPLPQEACAGGVRSL